MRIAASSALTVLAGCASVQPPGPTLMEFGALLPPATAARDLRCDFVEEEGSEWVCGYRAPASNGRLVRLSAAVARDGAGWVLIDSGCTPDEALAAPKRCVY